MQKARKDFIEMPKARKDLGRPGGCKFCHGFAMKKSTAFRRHFDTLPIPVELQFLGFGGIWDACASSRQNSQAGRKIGTCAKATLKMHHFAWRCVTFAKFVRFASWFSSFGVKKSEPKDSIRPLWGKKTAGVFVPKKNLLVVRRRRSLDRVR